MPGAKSDYIADAGAIAHVLSQAKWPLSTRIISKKLFGGSDRCIKGIELVLTQLILEKRVKPVNVKKNGIFYIHYVLGRENGMTEYKIEAFAKGTSVESVIKTDDPERAKKFVKLLAASGKWDNIQVLANRTVYNMETLDKIT